MSGRVVHFEMRVDDPERAIAFYSTVFGWQITKWDSPLMEYWMVMTGAPGSKEAGINGGMMRREHRAPRHTAYGQNAFICTVEVPNFDETAQKILQQGGAVLTPKFALPGMGWQGDFVDCEGNQVGVHQKDPKAA
jgi:uncharacterized protein